MGYIYDRRTPKKASSGVSFYSTSHTVHARHKVPFPVFIEDGEVFVDEETLAENVIEAIRGDAEPSFSPYGTAAEPDVGWSGGLEEVSVDKAQLEFEPVWDTKLGEMGTTEQLVKMFEEWMRRYIIHDKYDASDPDGYSRGNDYEFVWKAKSRSGFKVTFEADSN
jgi:hypothetical protein